jgi:hypothetical protein
MSELPAWYREDRYHLEDDGGVPVIRYAPGAGIKWRSGCGFCTDYGMTAEFFPDHGPKSYCPNVKSGARVSTHCTCDGCF